MKTAVAVLAGWLVATSVPAAFWKCELPGGVYMVNLPDISSISSHEYLVDGGARVTEVTIDTQGSVVARFYHLEILTPQSPIGAGQSVIDKAQEKLDEAAERTGQEAVWKKVVKNYPVATHAHTVEYRVDSKEHLTRILKSLERAWRTNAETNLKIP